MIKNIHLKNFKKHRSLRIDFNADLTLIVGENDSGKSSTIRALDIILNNVQVKESDFRDGENSFEIFLSLDDVAYQFIAEIDSSKNISYSKYKIIPRQSIMEIRRILAGLDTGVDELIEIKERLSIRTQARSLAGLRKAIAEVLDNEELQYQGGFRIESKILAVVNNFFLDGKKSEDLDNFIYQLYFKNRQKEIWDSEINGVKLIDFLNSKTLEYAESATRDVESSGLVNVLSEFLPEVKRITVNAEIDPKDITFRSKINFIDSDGNVRDFQNLGDGAKRRATFALVKHRASSSEATGLYVFDEPDTHLHVRAQTEFLDAIEDLYSSGNQIILTTHSPFIMNAVEIDHIRLLDSKNGNSRIKGIIRNESERNEYLNDLGIENIHLFFSRKILVVEGETEEIFFPAIYKKVYNRPLSRELVKVIGRKGHGSVSRFVKTIVEFMDAENVFVILDRDAEETYSQVAETLPAENVYRVGNKEFEDAFDPATIFSCWRDYVDRRSGKLSETWTEESVAKAISENGAKTFDSIRPLNSKSTIGMTKPALGQALAENCPEEELPSEIRRIVLDVKKSLERVFN